MLIMMTTFVNIPKVEVKTHQLKNGLKVFVVEDHSAPVATVQVWYRVGSKNEPLGMTGSAHLLEHMMFRGSKNVKGDYSQIIDRMGGMDNAFTSFDMTAYFSEIPSSRVEEVMRMEADRMRNLTFEGFDEERNVVLEERRWRTENNPEGALWEAIFATSFWEHPYHHPVIGWRSDLENVTLEQLKDFYRTYYAPNNAYLIVVGDVNPHQVFQWAEKYFGRYDPQKIPPFYTRESERKNVRRTELKKEGFATYLAITFPIPAYGSEETPVFDLLSELFGSGKSSRLYRAIVDEKGLASSISAFNYSLHDHGLFIIWAVLQQGKDAKELESAILEEVEKFKKEGISEEELQRAKNKNLASMIYNKETVMGQAMALGSSLIMTGDPDYLNRYPEMLQKVTREDVMKAANKYLDTRNMNVIVVHPIPPRNMEEYMKGLQKAQSIRR